MELFEYIDVMQKPYDIFHTNSVKSPLHWHYYSEILYIISGSVLIVCNNREGILHTGDICYFYPLQLHSVSEDTECTEKVRYALSGIFNEMAFYKSRLSSFFKNSLILIVVIPISSLFNLI